MKRSNQWLMVLGLATFCLVTLQVAVAAGATKPTNRGVLRNVKIGQLRREFRQPDRIYAPFIFWFWDQPLDTAKMVQMARVMASEGFNPGYAHARMSMVGTPSLPDDQWLGPKWFEAFGASLTEAQKHKTYLGYCDEYWWPSLQAHGRIVKQHPELKAQSLNWQVIDLPPGATAHVPASFTTVAARLLNPIAPKSLATSLDGAHWIWHPDGGPTPHTCRFRLNVKLDAKPEKALIKMSADNAFTLYVNGTRIGASDNWYVPETFDVASRLTAGDNLVCVEARNIDGPCGLLASISLQGHDGSVRVLNSDRAWQCSLSNPADWLKPGADVTGWARAREIAAANEGPWAGGFRSDDMFAHAKIVSSTLKVVGSGQPFDWTAPTDGCWRIYVFNQYYHPGVDGGQTNSIDERLAPVFIHTALQPYAQHMGSRMGKSIPGDFIDNEGDYGWKMAWSSTLDRQYRSRYGIDLRKQLPLLVDQDAEGKYAVARWRWFDLVSDLYCANFKAITAWHEQRGMYTTAHVWEEGIPAQVNAVGDHLKLLRSLTMPGQDCLGNKAVYVHDFKEPASVAAFEGRRAMTELMGAGAASGAPWGTFNPVFLKQAVNSVGAWGIAHIIPHGVFATRKLTGNPWPPDWYNENPFFPWLHLWNDFAARVCLINSVGHSDPDVLLYNPMESAWMMTSSDCLDTDLWSMPERNADGRRVNQLDKVYAETINMLTDARIEYLVGDRHYVGQMRVANGRLVRGPLSFKTVVLPPLRILTLDVARKLVRFAKSGGQVYALGALPDASAEHGVGDAQMAALMGELVKLPTYHSCAKQGNLKSALRGNASGLRSVITFSSGSFKMLQQRRVVDGKTFFWLVNNNEQSQACDITVAGAHGACSIWDCETGLQTPVDSTDTAFGSRVRLGFKPVEAYWLVFDPARRAHAHSARVAPLQQLSRVEGTWTVRCLPAIQPSMEYPVAPEPTLVAGMQKPLQDWSNWGSNKFSGLVDYTTTFRVTERQSRIILDLGRVCFAADVQVNGRSCGKRLWGPYQFDITTAVKPGVNRLRVRVANLINNSYGDIQPSGLFGPVRLLR